MEQEKQGVNEQEIAKKHIIYLAAGNSRRFGTNKLLCEFEGKPLYRHGLDMLEALCPERGDCFLTVVSQYREILDYAKKQGDTTVYSPDSIKGMSYTIRAAIEGLGEVAERDFLMFVVADQPYLSRNTVERILEKASETESACVEKVVAAEGSCIEETAMAERIDAVSASYQGIPGNPVMFSARVIPALLALKGDEGGRKVIGNCACVYVEAGEKRELYDIDTPEMM